MMSKKVFIFLLGMLVFFGLTAGADEHTRSAEFFVGQTIVHTNPAGFGSGFSHNQKINNWTYNPGMEPVHMQEYLKIDGGGTDATGDYVSCGTRRHDSLSSGYFDGAHYRLYREDLVEGKIEKIREGTIPVGGYIAAGYMQIGSGGYTLYSYAPNTEATDDHYTENGQTWYYAVKARDVEGEVSDYSAAISGVSPQAGITNGPRIKTASVSDPTVGEEYSKLVDLVALGGDLPLSWSISSGALPDGMSMNSDGRISGTCSNSTEITFTARVTDSSSNTHDRIFTMFRPDPTADGEVPAAPTNVVVEAHDGFVHISWDAPTETDIVSYQLYRSRKPESEHMERVYLEGSGIIPADDDLLFMSMESLDIPPKETRSVRVLQYQNDPTAWNRRGNYSWAEIVAHPGVLPAQFTNEFAGEGCLKLSTPSNEMFAIRQYRTAATSHDYWGTSQFPTGQTYRMECWVYGEGMTNDTLNFYYMNYIDAVVTGIVNGAWTKLSADFDATHWITNASGIFGPEFRFEGPGTVYIDNAIVYNVNDPEGPCHASQHVYDLWEEYIGPTNLTQKGPMRLGFIDDPFKHVLNPSIMSMRMGSLGSGAYRACDMHLEDMLKVACRSGSSPETRLMPWIIASLEWSETDYVNLIEYLAGPAGTPYGDLRIKQRDGVTTPWTDEFREIFIEMGNEPWNYLYFFNFGGGTPEAGATYGRWCQYIWDHVWTNSAYMTDIIKPVLGGWNGARSTNSFTANARRECPRSEHVGMTMYMGGWEAGQEGQIGGTTWSDEGVQQWPVYLDRSGRSVVDGSVDLQEAMAAEGRPFEWLVYESGPSYMQDGLNGVSLTDEEQATSKKYGRTLAAAIGSLDFYMYGVYRNIQEINFFQFVDDKLNWASHTYIHEGFRPHPSFMSLGMYNKAISPSSMLITAPLRMPTFDLEYEKDGETVVKPNMGLASSYAFRDGDRYSVLLLNKKVDGVHNGYDFGDGSTPATVRLPFSNPDSISLYKMEGDLRETNMDELNFVVATQSIDTAHFSSTFVVDEDTGGTTNGLPTGAIYMYVFEGCTPDTLPANPQVTVNQAPQQDDPQNGSVLNEINFAVIFDRPVTGFDSASDVTLGGTAEPQSIAIEETLSSFGTVYEVTVSGMAMPGTLTLSVPAGVAQAIDGGTSNDASTSLDNMVTIDFPTGMTLLEWEFINKNDFGDPADQDPDSTTQHLKIIPSTLGVGSGVIPYSNNKWYNDDGFVLQFAHSTSLDTNDYIGWTLTPTNGWEMNPETILLGAYCKEVVPYNVELRWSVNGFVTYETLTLTPTNQLIGSGGQGSTSGTELQGVLPYALQATTNAVEFRFYIWNTTASGVGGIGKLGDDDPDLLIRGLVAPAGTGAGDDDSDGLPNKWEQYHFGGPTNANPNATASNGVHTVKDCYIAGLDPGDAETIFQIDSLTFDPQSIIQWEGVPGRIYSVYWTSNLLSGFQPLETNVPWTSGAFTDTTRTTESKGFYKLEVELSE